MGSPVHDLAMREQSACCLGIDIEDPERARDVEACKWLMHGINPTIPTCYDGVACCHSVANSAGTSGSRFEGSAKPQALCNTVLGHAGGGSSQRMPLRLGGYAGPSELDGAVVHANQADCLQDLGTHKPAYRRSEIVLFAFLPCVREG
jgi:hypothetical protein